MALAGVTAQGLIIRTPAEVLERIKTKLREEFPGVDLAEGPEHQIAEVVAEELGEQWEALQASTRAVTRAAAGIALDEVSALTGTLRRVATRSTVLGTVTLGAGVTLEAGAIAAVATDPDAQFRTTAAVTNATGVPADVSVPMEAIRTGPVAAPSGTLTAIVTARTGWTAISNGLDARLGRAVAEDAELAAQRRIELAGAGSGTYTAIRAAVAALDEEGVISVSVRHNETLITDGDGRPGKSFEVIVWAGAVPPGGIEDLIAPAIYDNQPAGIYPWGVGSTVGEATDPYTGQLVEVEYTAAAALRVYVDLEVVLSGTQSAEWETAVKNAIRARAAEYAVGDKVYASQLIAAVLDDVPGVTAVTDLDVGTSASPTGALVTPLYYQLAEIAADDIAITEAP